MERPNYTKAAENVLKNAEKIAAKSGSPYIGTEHLLVSLIEETEGTASQVLRDDGASAQKILSMISTLRAPASDTALADRSGYTPRLTAVLQLAREQAAKYGSSEIGTEHLLLGLILERNNVALKVLETAGVHIPKVYYNVLLAMNVDPNQHRNDLAPQQGAGANAKGGLLAQFTRDLTEDAREGKLDPVIGRENETSRLLEILSRRTKNNPCLIGDPGVGKTAIVEGLAEKIAEDAVPAGLRGKRVLMLDLAGMVAGTKYRGEFEERIKGVISEVIAAGDVILFADEMHTLIGAGSSEGALDASNILKPSLARGELQLIGATTEKEFRRIVGKDSALERRFQPIEVGEPTREETLAILKGIAPRYEAFHHVQITEDALQAAVNLTDRYINDRCLPDKAIDAIDEACASARLLAAQKGENPQVTGELSEIDNELAKAVKEGRIDDARTLRSRYQTVEAGAKKAASQKEKKDEKSLRVTEGDVARVVSLWSQVPVARLTEKESTRLLKLESTLHKRVIGQEDAVTAVAKAIRRGRVGLQDPKRPIGTFLFLGPTGVGKTELSKALAEAVFGDEKSLIRIDMSEYSERIAVTRLTGSAPGYVGYEEGGQLTEEVRRHPYSVVLFDEIEKANPEVYNLLLQIMDEGRLTDGKGSTVNFRNTILIMTSNLGARQIAEPKTLGFAPALTAKESYEKMKSGVMEELGRTFRPEFINRIDGIEVFHTLSKEDMKKICALQCNEFSKRAEGSLGIRVSVTPSMRDHLVDKYYNQKMGARPLKRAMQTEVEDPFADRVLEGEFQAGDTVKVGYSRDKVTFSKAESEKKAEAASKEESHAE